MRPFVVSGVKHGALHICTSSLVVVGLQCERRLRRLMPLGKIKGRDNQPRADDAGFNISSKSGLTDREWLHARGGLSRLPFPAASRIGVA